MLESGAAAALDSMGYSKMVLVVHGGVWGLGNPGFAARSVVEHCQLPPECRFRVFCDGFPAG